MSNGSHSDDQSRQVCTFYLDNQLFGIDVLSVQEVVRFQEMTSVPLTSPEITGLINLRGRIVTAIDLRKRLHMDERAEDSDPPQNIIVHGSDDKEVVSLLVDEIGDVLQVQESAFERVPNTLSPEFRSLIVGAYKLEKQLLLLLDVDKTLNISSAIATAEA